jgi:hypothetical protein
MKSQFSRHFGGGVILLALGILRVEADSATPPSPAPSSAASLIEKATQDQAAGKLEEGAREASAALVLDPQNKAALELRGTIYVEEKLWDRASRDFATLIKISPDPAYRYKLAEIKFLQHQYDDARPLFAVLKNDPNLGDLARYDVFICDLFGFHEDIAARDLATLDSTGKLPSYYYGRAAWAYFHSQNPLASHLVAQASGKFNGTVNRLYMQAFVVLHPFLPSVATFQTRDGRRFDHARVELVEDGLRAYSPQGWVTLPLSQLPEDLSSFPEDLRTQIVLRLGTPAAPKTADESSPITFTTRSGKTYRQVRWMLDDSGLIILAADGWLTVHLDDLPDDLSSFPPDLRKQIAAALKSRTAEPGNIAQVTFTTRKGTAYNGVRASLASDGVMVVTPNGWITIPFAELPDDLSPFPEGWRTLIQSGRKERDENPASMHVVSFTTRRGKSFDHVRASLGDSGLQVLSPDGWVVIAYNQLPDDLSPFPASWRETITARQKDAAKTAPRTRP